jgi:hypothetical protein
VPVVVADSASTEVKGRVAPAAAWAVGAVAVRRPAARATVIAVEVTVGVILTDLRVCCMADPFGVGVRG